MTEPELLPQTDVYVVLLHRAQLWGVPVKIVLWILMVTLTLVLLWVATAPTLLSKALGATGIFAAAGVVHLVLRWSGQQDHDLLEVWVRFLSYPRYLGPR